MPLAKSTQNFVQKMINASNPLGIDIRTLGCNENVDSAKVLTKYIMSQPVSAVVNLFIPPGTFYLQSCLNYFDRKVNIRGAGRGISIVYVAPGIDGIWIRRKKGIGVFDWVFQDFGLYALGKVVPGFSGIKVWERGIIRNLDVQGFSGNGIHIDGYVGGDPEQDADHDASFTKVYDCYIASNGGHGVEIQGKDANACVTFANDIRNNGGWGIWDSSLLGGTHIGNMFHANAKGAYTVDGGANQSTIVGGYIENDHGPNVFPNDLVTVIGGYSEAGNKNGKIF